MNLQEIIDDLKDIYFLIDIDENKRAKVQLIIQKLYALEKHLLLFFHRRL